MIKIEEVGKILQEGIRLCKTKEEVRDYYLDKLRPLHADGEELRTTVLYYLREISIDEEKLRWWERTAANYSLVVDGVKKQVASLRRESAIKKLELLEKSVKLLKEVVVVSNDYLNNSRTEKLMADAEAAIKEADQVSNWLTYRVVCGEVID